MRFSNALRINFTVTRGMVWVCDAEHLAGHLSHFRGLGSLSGGSGVSENEDQLKFLLQARGSLQELMDELNVCIDENYLAPTEVEQIKQSGWRVHNLINGYGRYLRQRNRPSVLRCASSRQNIRQTTRSIPSMIFRFNVRTAGRFSPLDPLSSYRPQDLGLPTVLTF
jgi:hypothetical protein